MTHWDFQNKGKSAWTGNSSFVLEVALRHLRPSIIYSVLCDRIRQGDYYQCPCSFSHVFYISPGCVSLSAIARVWMVLISLKCCRILGPEIYDLVLTFISERFSE